MTPELVFPFAARYELVLHDQIPRELGIPVWQLPAVVQPDRQQQLAQAPIVEVRPAAGEPWVGVLFAAGEPNVSGTVIGWPDESSFCFFGGGGAYVVDSADARRVTLIESHDLRHYLVAAHLELIVFAGWTDLVAYGAEGLRWRSGELCEDDLYAVGFDGDTLRCTGFFAGSTDVPFAIDLRTGKLVDGPGYS